MITATHHVVVGPATLLGLGETADEALADARRQLPCVDALAFRILPATLELAEYVECGGKLDWREVEVDGVLTACIEEEARLAREDA